MRSLPAHVSTTARRQLQGRGKLPAPELNTLFLTSMRPASQPACRARLRAGRAAVVTADVAFAFRGARNAPFAKIIAGGKNHSLMT